MTNEFRASNGWHIDADGVLREANGRCVGYGGDIDRLREFFQELRDHELGRWRDPENPEYVVYPDKEKHFIDQPAVRVVNETTGAMGCASLAGASSSTGLAAEDPGIREAAKRYFEVHPVRKPLPEAKGLYVNATDAREFLTEAAVLTRDYEGWHHYGDPRTDAESMAQKWHDAGELVRLVPEGGDDE